MNTINNPLVSVIIPTYKRSDYLIRAIESVINQTYSPIEIIVVDDNDGDNEFRKDTKKNVGKYIASNNIIYVEHEFNKGISAARNTGLESAKGEYIAFLDDDDEFLPEKIALQVACFQSSNSSVGLVYGSFIRFETDSNTERIIKPKHAGNLQNILGLNHIGSPSMVMCTKKAIDKVNGFDVTFRSREDIDFYYRLAKHYNFSYVQDVIMKYYIHPNIQLSKIHTDKIAYMIQFIEKYGLELENPVSRWSEIQERLGELHAVNGNRKMALGAFAKAYKVKPKRFSILVKAGFALLGSKMYRKIRKVS